MDVQLHNDLIKLIRLGIGHKDVSNYTDSVDWQAIKAHADKQGLTAVVVDGIEQLPDAKRPPKEMLLQWIGEVFQSYENRYKLYQRAIAELAGWYNAHGYKMMVLKGYACSLDWPKPEHRPCGDIDIWLFGKQKESDSLLDKELGINIDSSEHHHTVFYWRGFMVENHYDFIEVHHHSSSPILEKILKGQGKNDSHFVELNGERVYIPSPNLHALFLLRHMMEHFASTDITLRQLLDWAFFVKEHGKDVGWKWLEDVLEQFGMKKLYCVFNAICVEDLGFEVSLFSSIQYEPSLKDRVLNEILAPEFTGEQPSALLPRIVFKYRRWQANGWKQKLCYKGSRWSAFWSATWNHILKPSSI